MQTVCLGVNLKHKPLARVAIIEKSHLITEAGLTLKQWYTLLPRFGPCHQVHSTPDIIPDIKIILPTHRDCSGA